MKEPEESLPLGYYTSPEDRVDFELAKPSGGINGLQWAVMLRAVEDGCNAEWLEEIARFYEIHVPDGFFRRTKAQYVIVSPREDRFIPINLLRGGKQQMRAEWADAMHPRLAFGGR